MRIKIVLLSLLVSATVLSSCTPYKMEIRQGNLVMPEMREKLKVGMTRQQVKFLMGTPMISDPFHENRWDYMYRLEQSGELVEQKNMTLYFEGDILSRIVDGNSAAEMEPEKAD